MRTIYKVTKKIFLPLLFAILINLFVFDIYTVNGNSMYPFLNNEDVIIIDKISLKFIELKKNDIVLIKMSSNIIKRIIALPSDKVEIKNKILFVNNKKITKVNQNFNYSIVLDDNEYFVLGDNVNESMDSRVFGAINKKEIIGKYQMRVYSKIKTGVY